MFMKELLDILDMDIDVEQRINESINNGEQLGYNKDSKYSVVGIVTTGHVFVRRTKTGKSNITKSVGYKLRDTDGNEYYVEKSQGIKIGLIVGYSNSYLRVQNRKEGKTIYLTPSPSYNFTSDENLTTVFRLDEDGKVKLPIENLLINKKDYCTTELWNLITYKMETSDKQYRKQPLRARLLRELNQNMENQNEIN